MAIFASFHKIVKQKLTVFTTCFYYYYNTGQPWISAKFCTFYNLHETDFNLLFS